MKKVFNFEKYYKNIAIKDDMGNSFSYYQLAELGNIFYSNINKRTLVFLLCSNSAYSIIGYAACLNHEIVPIILSENIDIELLNNLLIEYKPEFIWLPTSRNKELSFESIYSIGDYSLLSTKFETPIMYNDLCILVTTSGSTGSLKLVRQSYKNVKSISEMSVRLHNINYPDAAITTLPMSYTYCISMINNFFQGGATILCTKANVIDDKFWEFFKKESATYFGGISFTYEMLDKINFYDMDLPSIKYMTQGGTKLSNELHSKHIKNAKGRYQFLVLYGATETTGLMSYLSSEDSLNKIGSIGTNIEIGKLYLKNENGENIINSGVEGELVYEGSNVSLGYATCRQDLIKGDERHGRYETGDMAVFDEDGFFYITGRKKRFLKIYGHRVSLDEIDQLITTGFSGLNFATSGIDDYIYIFTTKSDSENSIAKFLSRKTKLPIISFREVLVENIPRNESGKISYKKLADIIKKRD